MTEAKQGHRYQWNGIDVLSMENGHFPQIQRITPDAGCTGCNHQSKK